MTVNKEHIDPTTSSNHNEYNTTHTTSMKNKLLKPVKTISGVSNDGQFDVKSRLKNNRQLLQPIINVHPISIALHEKTQKSGKFVPKIRTRSLSPHGSSILPRSFRSLSRSRKDGQSHIKDDLDETSSIGSLKSLSSMGSSKSKNILVAITSCRSDAYHAQKAPGSTSMLPRKAPSALKIFHELAVGVKDAYAAVGETPQKPHECDVNDGIQEIEIKMNDGEKVLWEFMGNLDFLLALVDEVATDSVTRGALKDDNTFKNLRDVIKKCNKILDNMLVRRERKYTLFFRLVQPLDKKDIKKMKSWNSKVEKAVGALASGSDLSSDTTSEVESEASSFVPSVSGSSDGSNKTSAGKNSGLFRRGRISLPIAGRVRGRRATPTPSMRNRFLNDADSSTSADDGFSTVMAPVTSANLAKLQQSLPDGDQSSVGIPRQLVQLGNSSISTQSLSNISSVEAKNELVDVIRGLRTEKNTKRGNVMSGSQLSDLKPNWHPKAEIPSSVPQLSMEYIHRHRLMKQVVDSLLNRSDVGVREGQDDHIGKHIITSITSRHADKAGNGKTTLGVAAIQTVEIRERFSEGIAWIQLGQTPLTEEDIRRLYEELYTQLAVKRVDMNNVDCSTEMFSSNSASGNEMTSPSRFRHSIEKDDTMKYNFSVRNSLVGNQLEMSRKSFQSGDLEGIKEDLGKMISKRNILIYLDDVWRVEDAKWFIFDTIPGHFTSNDTNKKSKYIQFCPYRILITTRTPGLLGKENAHEVFVRIFSEHEAVKLLLSSAGRRIHGGKNSTVYNQARVIVKGCGNTPLALRLAGGMLRTSNRNWTLSSSTWISLVEQCKACLGEASKIRSFINSVGRIVDLSFITVPHLDFRASLRRCFVTFAIVFHDNDWIKSRKGIPRGVLINLFNTVVFVMNRSDHDNIFHYNSNSVTTLSEKLLDMLEHMNLLQRVRHTNTNCCSFPKNSLSCDNPNFSSKSSVSARVSIEARGMNKSKSNDIHETFDGIEARENYLYLMPESIKYIAEEMATRLSPSFAPKVDEFTSFVTELESEMRKDGHVNNGHWLSNAAKYFFSSQRVENSSSGMSDRQFHELIVLSLSRTGNENTICPLTDILKENKYTTKNESSRELNEQYIAAYLPTHLIRSKMLKSASIVLTDKDFIARRVSALGVVESSRRQVGDLLDLRREIQRLPFKGDFISHLNDSSSDPFKESNSGSDYESQKYRIDINLVQREASRLVIEEAHRILDMSSSADTLNMAVCIYTIGNGFFKARQDRDALLRLEEAVGIYRRLLGPFHVDVARVINSLAKVLVKLGEKRGALMKFGEASKIFESCNSNSHYDSIVNIQLMANLLVDLGDWVEAEKKYENVISLKKTVYGTKSLPVARSIYDYAVVMAKYGQIDESLYQYEVARKIYEELLSTETTPCLSFSVYTQDSLSKISLDITLIYLNIASIKSKKGNLKGAITSYERGVCGLRLYLEKASQGENEYIEISKLLSLKRHLVSAISRIGSLKMKERDHQGALQAYLALIKEVDCKSPTSSKMEKAKAYVKSATIYRQMGNLLANKNAVNHLIDALKMYTDLHGNTHKDTKAIALSLQKWKEQDNSSPISFGTTVHTKT